MSDLLFTPEAGSRARAMKRVQGKCTFGSAAIGTSSISGATMTRTAAGTYTITCESGFVKLKNASIVLNSASATPIALNPQIYDVSASTGVIKFKLLTASLTGSATWDVADLADGAQESKDITVTGAALGDIAVASLGVDVVDLIVTANVTATDTVTITVANETGGNVNLASTTARVRVFPIASVAAADPASGSEVYIELGFSDTELDY